MSEVLVKVEAVSKKYCRSLNKAMLYGVSDIAGDLLGKYPTSEKLRDEEFWAVKDASFEVKRGECFGLIGPNGAGKSTLMKMINGIFMPDQGSVSIVGKVVAMIEIGAGFHPMLTGRENVYVSAAIMGMSRLEVDSKLDSIIEFSGLEGFIDMPVRNYSSGMYVRLGFAVAIHVEPDVLIMDEVLAVGDMAFRAKCYQAIDDLRKHCAIIFVSHNMSEVGRVCDRGALIDHGQVAYVGTSASLVAEYNRRLTSSRPLVTQYLGGDKVEIKALKYFQGDLEISELEYAADLQLYIEMQVNKPISDAVINISFENATGESVFQCSNNISSLVNLESGSQCWSASMARFPLCPGSYTVSILIQSSDLLVPYVWVKGFQVITVRGTGAGASAVRAPVRWLFYRGDVGTG
jgi:lipopolysaccharide transport system ATP-binding protein